jgi:hypothetical protein
MPHMLIIHFLFLLSARHTHASMRSWRSSPPHPPFSLYHWRQKKGKTDPILSSGHTFLIPRCIYPIHWSWTKKLIANGEHQWIDNSRIQCVKWSRANFFTALEFLNPRPLEPLRWKRSNWSLRLKARVFLSIPEWENKSGSFRSRFNTWRFIFWAWEAM